MTAATDWISAVGTVGTLSTGLVLFAGTIADRRRGYANAVSVWTELERIDREAFEWKHEDDAGTSIEARIELENWDNLAGPFDFRLRVKNGGPQPIYGCRLKVILAQGGLPTGAYPVIYSSLSVELGILGPDVEMPPKSLLMGAPHRGHDFREFLAKAMSFELIFTDTAGRTWSRDQRGRLRRVGGLKSFLGGSRWRRSERSDEAATAESSLSSATTSPEDKASD